MNIRSEKTHCAIHVDSYVRRFTAVHFCLALLRIHCIAVSRSRCIVLVDAVTTTVFNYVRRGLFERDKLTVATMLTLKILVNDGLLTQEEVDYLVMSKVRERVRPVASAPRNDYPLLHDKL